MSVDPSDTRCPNRADFDIRPAQCGDPYFATEACAAHVAIGLGHRPEDPPPTHYIVTVLASDTDAQCCSPDTPAGHEGSPPYCAVTCPICCPRARRCRAAPSAVTAASLYAPYPLVRRLGQDGAGAFRHAMLRDPAYPRLAGTGCPWWTCCVRNLRAARTLDVLAPCEGTVPTCLLCAACRGCAVCSPRRVTYLTMSKGAWTSQNGRVNYPFQMDDKHLKNTIKKLMREQEDFKPDWHEWVVVLDTEAKLRGLR